jgi:hypothetical protein
VGGRKLGMVGRKSIKRAHLRVKMKSFSLILSPPFFVMLKEWKISS